MTEPVEGVDYHVWCHPSNDVIVDFTAADGSIRHMRVMDRKHGRLFGRYLTGILRGEQGFCLDTQVTAVHTRTWRGSCLHCDFQLARHEYSRDNAVAAIGRHLARHHPLEHAPSEVPPPAESTQIRVESS